MTDGEIGEFRAAVWEFWRSGARRLPWRDTRDPYAVLVSEVMLQQTQVARVCPKWDAWLALFPTSESLAAADNRDVLAAWSGLGYNSRALRLKAACAAVGERFGGSFPRSATDLETLPGVGPYTARAVSCFAFGNPEFFIETNIRRLAIHSFFPGDVTVDDRDILPLLERALDGERPREWNWAMMDYGAELARWVQNPNRRSSSYSRQSDFSTSVRRVRGAIVRTLVAGGEMGAEALRAATGSGDGPDGESRYGEALRALVREGIVAEKSGRYSIA